MLKILRHHLSANGLRPWQVLYPRRWWAAASESCFFLDVYIYILRIYSYLKTHNLFGPVPKLCRLCTPTHPSSSIITTISSLHGTAIPDWQPAMIITRLGLTQAKAPKIPKPVGLWIHQNHDLDDYQLVGSYASIISLHLKQQRN